MSRPPRLFSLIACLCLALGGCAVEQHPARLLPLEQTRGARQFILARALDFRLDTFYLFQRSLLQGGRWTHIARLPQGEVYQPDTSVFTIEGRAVHEAWLVVDSGRLVGFYLPAEHSFSPLEEAPAIALVPLPSQAR